MDNEKIYTLHLTGKEVQYIREGLMREVRCKYSGIGAFSPYISKEYVDRVLAEAEEIWDLIGTLARLGDIPEEEGGTVEGEPAPMPSETEAERSAEQ